MSPQDPAPAPAPEAVAPAPLVAASVAAPVAAPAGGPAPRTSPQGADPRWDALRSEALARVEAALAALSDLSAPAAAPAPGTAPEAEGASPVSLAARKAERAERLRLKAEREAGGPAPAAAAKARARDEDDDEDERPRAPRPAAGAAPAPTPFAAPALPARPRGRHWLVLSAFALMVIVPTALCAWYMWTRAVPRYASDVGFSVRTEDVSSAIELLGGLAALGGGSSSSDTDILYRFIQSQELVEIVDEQLDLRAMWSGPADEDPVFAYHAPGTIEDLVAYWRRMVSVYNDAGTGLIDIEVQAFAPEDAQAIAEAITEESGALVNRLSTIAQEDAMRYAREELAASVERLKGARAALTRFRNATQIVDPALSIQAQTGLLSSLEAQLAATLIDLDILRQTAAPSDPRILASERRVEVIQARMADERAKMGLGAAPGAAAIPATATGPAPADLAAPAVEAAPAEIAPPAAGEGAPAEGGDGGAPGLRPLPRPETLRPGAAATGQAAASAEAPGAQAALDLADEPLPEGAAFADLLGEYERLAVDQEFAQQAYTAALASYDAALAESSRQSRYLAAHVHPTLAERAEYPQRIGLTLLTGLFAFLAWAVATLAGYAIRDRR